MNRLLCLALLASALLRADDLPQQAAAVLRRNCTGCHGAALKVAKLDLRTRESLLAGGERGPAVEPGNASNSRLYRMVAAIDQPSMPPGKPLSADQVDLLKRWIDGGAALPAASAEPKEDALAALAKLEERPVTDDERRYWAFQPPVRHVVPSVGARNPVDAFLLAALRAKGLSPGPPADRRALLRRAHLDLTGLPPTPADVERFLEDRSPDAFAKVVDLLLASPHYGERWGRHWLDLVRYADSGGFEYDRDRPNSWRYRDYVVKAFNDDKPYDRFLREQVAGDEIDPESWEGRIATGYLRLGPENNLKNEQTRMDELDDLVATTSNAFLGLTVGCARCHNHKFDPIPQKDYYRLQAVFFPTKAQEYPLARPEEVEQHKAEQARISERQAPLKQQIAELEKPYRDALLAEKKAGLPEYIRIALQTPPERRTEGQRLNATQVEKTLAVDAKDILARLSPTGLARHRELSAQVDLLEAARPQPLPTAMAVMEPGREAPPSHFLHRGSPGQKGTVMRPGVLTVASTGEWGFPEPPAGASTSHRRRGFAEWLASPENPLTARVMVNRIWLHHFGDGLVRTPNNFGKMGDRPSHPELLDWLATEFVRQGWSMKAMHRLLMTSEAYQRSSDDMEGSRLVDPDNRLLWRMPRRRLEGEGIRDAIFAVAGNLDRRIGGPAVHPYIDPALFQSSSKRTWVGKPDKDPSTWRRSLYVFSKRSIPLPMLEVFDKPDTIGSCARRNRSTIAPQALILMNNAVILMEAAKFAERLRREAGQDTAAQVRLAFELALSRPPTPAESRRAVEFVRADANGLVDFCQTVFNLNEFVYLP